MGSTTSPVLAKDGDGQAARCEHLVVVVLGGGVRSRDMLDKALMPTLQGLAEECVVVDRVRSEAPDAWSGAARILTGTHEEVDGGARSQPRSPTLMEYVRDGAGLRREEAWFLSFESGPEAERLCHGLHPEYGAALAAATAEPGGPFAGPLSGFLERMGRPVPIEEEAWEPLRAMRAASREAASIWLPAEVDAGQPKAERVERALLRELDRRALFNEGPSPRDEGVWRAALTVLDVHAPRLLVLRLGEAEVAEVSASGYRAVLAANDQGLHRLTRAVAEHPAMAGRTAIVVVADRGRDEREDAQGRLRESDASRERREVLLVAWGAGLLPHKKFKGERTLADVCPTLAALLGVPAPHAKGRIWSEILRPR